MPQATRKPTHLPRVYRLASKLGLTDPSRTSLNRIECGLHSGFPKCCIAFFVKVWGPLMDAYDGKLDEQDPLALDIMDGYRAFIEEHAGRCGYVPCPACVLAGNIRPVKSCDCTRRRKSR